MHPCGRSASSVEQCASALGAGFMSFLSATSGEIVCKVFAPDLLGQTVSEIKRAVSMSLRGTSRFRIQLLLHGRALSEEEIPIADDTCYSSCFQILFLTGRSPTSDEMKFITYCLDRCNHMGLHMALMRGIDPSTFCLRTPSGRTVNLLQISLDRDFRGEVRLPIRRSSQPIMSEMLVDANADVNMAGSFKTTPLMSAVRLGYEEGVTFLLMKEADPNRSETLHRETALHMAARVKNLSIAQKLIWKRADVNARTVGNGASHAQTALDIALQVGCDGMVDLCRYAGQ